MAESEKETKWTYKSETEALGANQGPAQAGDKQAISWTASEFIDKHKGSGWYFSFFAGLIILSAGVFFFTKDYISSAAIIIAGLIFVFVIKKKPQQLPYEINSRGIQIGVKFYQYDMFKSFDLALDGGIKSIDLIPLKRFMPEISIYFPPEQEEAIVSMLANHLPHSEQTEKTADKLAKKLRF